MLNRRQTTRRLLQQSVAILKSNRQALLSPLCSNLVILGLLALILHPIINHQATRHFFEQAPLIKILLFYVFVLVFLFITHIFAFFFMTTLATHILHFFAQQQCSFMSSIKTVCRRFFTLYAFFLYASLAGFVFVMLQKSLRKNCWFQRLTQGLNWKIAIHFVIPILVQSDLKTTDAIRRSSQLMSETWGKPLKFNYGFGGYSFQLKCLALIPLLLALIQGGYWLIISGSSISICLILIISSCFMSLRMIVCCGCYLYASKQPTDNAIDSQALASAFCVFVPE